MTADDARLLVIDRLEFLGWWVFDRRNRGPRGVPSRPQPALPTIACMTPAFERLWLQILTGKYPKKGKGPYVDRRRIGTGVDWLAVVDPRDRSIWMARPTEPDAVRRSQGVPLTESFPSYPTVEFVPSQAVTAGVTAGFNPS